MTSTVDLPEHDVDRSEKRHDVRDEVSLHQPWERLQVAERRWANAKTIRRVRLAVTGDEEPELPLGRLDRVVRLPCWRFDEPGDPADDWSLRQAVERLPNDPRGLSELPHAQPVPIVRVAPRAVRNAELAVRVGRVG